MSASLFVLQNQQLEAVLPLAQRPAAELPPREAEQQARQAQVQRYTAQLIDWHAAILESHSASQFVAHHVVPKFNAAEDVVPAA